jgi:hypothetical protein
MCCPAGQRITPRQGTPIGHITVAMRFRVARNTSYVELFSALKKDLALLSRIWAF